MSAQSSSASGPITGRPSNPTVTVITRVDCHLCQDAEAALARLQAELGFALVRVDVDSSDELLDEYNDRVPVILIDGAEHGYWRLEEPRFRVAIARRSS